MENNERKMEYRINRIKTMRGNRQVICTTFLNEKIYDSWLEAAKAIGEIPYEKGFWHQVTITAEPII